MMANSQTSCRLTAPQGSIVRSGSTGSSRKDMTIRTRPARISSQVTVSIHECSCVRSANRTVMLTAAAMAVVTSPTTARTPSRKVSIPAIRVVPLTLPVAFASAQVKAPKAAVKATKAKPVSCGPSVGLNNPQMPPIRPDRPKVRNPAARLSPAPSRDFQPRSIPTIRPMARAAARRDNVSICGMERSGTTGTMLRANTCHDHDLAQDRAGRVAALLPARRCGSRCRKAFG